MPQRRLHKDAASLWFEAPFVMAMRIHEMQMAALTGRSQDAAEMNRMVTEKVMATAESAVAVNMAISRAAFGAAMQMMTGGRPSARKAGEAIAAAAVKPYGKRVRSNARRLSRKKVSSS